MYLPVLCLAISLNAAVKNIEGTIPKYVVGIYICVTVLEHYAETKV